MDKFEELSNTDLREKLKLHGLGNIPVTDTTRNLLIKRLRVATGNAPAKPNKGRRETVNVIKSTTDDLVLIPNEVDTKKASKTKTPSNRRATIAAAAAATGKHQK